ncbi:hypothetical protein EDB92DRAFT_1886952 [Lactarius akahatsu]|uniref:Uncharacterized protein n=1 Tax=Lactarius akahatsu TaxID=416441 RepID=A0AAD4QA13_9AGAM|nr:hypothetical protein EDB92DRAFT_1886952 [Lactarius akahatsu]
MVVWAFTFYSSPLFLVALPCRTVVEILNIFLFFVMISYLQIILYLLYLFWAERTTGRG